MKAGRIGIYLIVALIGFFVACRHDDPTPAVPDGYVELQAGTTVPVLDGISVVVDTAGVTICPKNGYCFAANSVHASVRLVKAQFSQRVKLFGFSFFGERVYPPVDASRTDSTRLELAGQAYKVILKGQYIGEKDGQGQGRAVLQVSRL